MTTEVSDVTAEVTEQEKVEFTLLGILVLAALYLGYRNKDKIKEWINAIFK
jgi:hypothetical protein